MWIKKTTRCNSVQIFIYCKITLHVSGVTTPIIRSIKNCNRSLRYGSYYLYRYSPPTWSHRDWFVRLDWLWERTYNTISSHRNEHYFFRHASIYMCMKFLTYSYIRFLIFLCKCFIMLPVVLYGCETWSLTFAGGKEAEGVWEHGVEENIWS